MMNSHNMMMTCMGERLCGEDELDLTRIRYPHTCPHSKVEGLLDRLIRVFRKK